MSGESTLTPTRILVVGAGGREHALAWKLGAEPGVEEVIVAPGSDAMAALPRVRRLPDVDPLDPGSVLAAARATVAELVVVGPEAPLAAGVADALAADGIPVFGPTAAAARIESSKAFCHQVAAAAGVPMARSGAFDDAGPAIDFARSLEAAGRGVVVKADGLAAGKGVTVASDIDEAVAAIRVAVTAGPVVIEERLEGREASLIALCDGREAVALPISRDHKRLRDGDAGPNTGGMGAYSPLPDLPDASADGLLDRFHRPILAELARRGSPFRGALYAGLMLTADGPVLLECNARFGDPETQAILPRLAGPLGPWLLAAARGRLAAAGVPSPDAARLPVLPEATVAVVLAAAGYPEASRHDDTIIGLDRIAVYGALVFHSGTVRSATGGYRTAGGRVLAVVGRGDDLAAARDVADRAAEWIVFDGAQRRRDIAADALADGPTPGSSVEAGP
ncbi:MAG: phosphoribosylamine--glycine ligase [Chloroflexota bacterium]|jgi:phosphoribosylamine--glycine ligase|nr:phosphoribosylamine--glycine ligase [Chloroflexota bacterium]MDH5243454.1 phosphoribosylamine--glycine ligase [Chloroflexota bacterium]